MRVGESRGDTGGRKGMGGMCLAGVFWRPGFVAAPLVYDQQALKACYLI
jgi:hypothetical protein